MAASPPQSAKPSLDRRILVSLLLAALLAFVGFWLLLATVPGERAVAPAVEARFPWQVERDAAGRVTVFGLRLGANTLADLRALLGANGKVNLFVRPDGSLTVEAYFQDILLANLRADWVATLEATADELAAWHARGLRVSTLGSGSRRVTLAPEDSARLADKPLRHLTYLPWRRLTARDLTAHFGLPARLLDEPGGTRHWLYPELGLDIAQDAKGRTVLQYLNAEDFAAAVEALEAAGALPIHEPLSTHPPRQDGLVTMMDTAADRR